jgi:hypothetical protein
MTARAALAPSPLYAGERVGVRGVLQADGPHTPALSPAYRGEEVKASRVKSCLKEE